MVGRSGRPGNLGYSAASSHQGVVCDILLTDLERVDHRVAMVEVRSHVVGEQAVPCEPVSSFATRRALRDPQAVSLVEQLWAQVPIPPIGMCVHEHERLLAKRARMVYAEACPKVTASPRADWMEEATWTLVRQAAFYKRTFRRTRANGDRWLARFAFQSWAMAAELCGIAE